MVKIFCEIYDEMVFGMVWILDMKDDVWFKGMGFVIDKEWWLIMINYYVVSFGGMLIVFFFKFIKGEVVI